jgi:hypothetical protein
MERTEKNLLVVAAATVSSQIVSAATGVSGNIALAASLLAIIYFLKDDILDSREALILPGVMTASGVIYIAAGKILVLDSLCAVQSSAATSPMGGSSGAACRSFTEVATELAASGPLSTPGVWVFMVFSGILSIWVMRRLSQHG